VNDVAQVVDLRGLSCYLAASSIDLIRREE